MIMNFVIPTIWCSQNSKFLNFQQATSQNETGRVCASSFYLLEPPEETVLQAVLREEEEPFLPVKISYETAGLRRPESGGQDWAHKLCKTSTHILFFDLFLTTTPPNKKNDKWSFAFY